MANNYTTPGVYVQELPGFPPGVAQIQSAVPIFIGLTANTTAADGTVLLNTPASVSSMLDVNNLFGGPPTMNVLSLAMTCSTASTGGTVADTVTTATTTLPSVLYHSLELYFANGGGPCYVISVGGYTTNNAPTPLTASMFTTAVQTLSKHPEPTLIICSDAVLLSAAADYYSVVTGALQFAEQEAVDYRFLLLDLQEYGAAGAAFNYTNPTTPYYAGFRTGIGINYLDGAAAYTPYLEALVSASTNYIQITTGFNAWVKATKSPLTFPVPPTGVNPPKTSITPTQEATLRSTWPAYKTIAEAVEGMSVLMPPSGAVAGVYFATDANRGFWKAPANVSLNNVVDVAYRIDDPTNGLLNVDSVGGKSINAIRSFTGQGILVWGARTLAGNDTDWRYVSVRRTVSIIEQSIKNSINWAVFEPNDDHLWLRVKGMITDYLTELWKDGALQGSSASQAFYVNVGLGTTMTSQDLLDGKLIVAVGLAVVRPAEFIILQFIQFAATS